MQNIQIQTQPTHPDVNTISIPEKPALAPNIKLAGEMPETGFEQKQWLIQRGAKFIQVGELLYRVAELIDGERTLEDIAGRMTETTEWEVTRDHIVLILEKMIPLGIITTENTGVLPDESAVRKPDFGTSSLGIQMRAQVIGPHIIQPIARFFQVLYKPIILVPILLVVAVVHLWLYLIHGISNSFLDILYRPWGFPIVIGLLIVSGVFHEFGHAAALTYGGGQVRGMGAGLYFIYPAFYTDLTDSYRLGRWARVRTDLGGFYFYLISTLLIVGLYFATGAEFLLLTVLFINIDILYQLIPLVRLDGYWVLADLTGMPDPLTHMKPFLASMVKIPGRKRHRTAELKPWVKKVFLAYTLLTIPLLLVGLGFMVYRLPRFVTRLYDSIAYQVQIFSLAWGNGDIPGMIILGVSIFILATMIFGSLYLFSKLLTKGAQGLWRWSKSTLKRRVSGAIISLAVVALVGFIWLPHFQVLFHAAPQGVQAFTVASSNHTDLPVTYEQSPPIGGDHAPVWQNCGYYDAPIPNENAVHSLEHGAVWITYSPDLPQSQASALRQLAYRQAYVIVSPYPDLKASVVVSAWGRQLAVESASDPKLEQFIRAFRLGDQAPESGESCTGGVGSPQ